MLWTRVAVIPASHAFRQIRTSSSYDHAVEIADGLPFGQGALEIREIE